MCKRNLFLFVSILALFSIFTMQFPNQATAGSDGTSATVTFRTFEELQELCAQTYSVETAAVYQQASEDLTILSDLTVPENLWLTIYNANLVIPQNVTLETKDICRVSSERIDGTHIVCSVGSVSKTLTVNGSMVCHTSLSILDGFLLSGLDRIQFTSGTPSLSVNYVVSDENTLGDILPLSDNENVQRISIVLSDTVFTLTNSVTIPSKCSVSVSGELEISENAVLTLLGNVTANGPVTVRGTLDNCGEITIHTWNDGCINVVSNGSCVGTGKITVIDSSPAGTDIASVLRGMDITQYLITEEVDQYHTYWYLEYRDPSSPLPTDPPADTTDSGSCGEGLTWTLANGVLSIDGDGAMLNYTGGTAPWYPYRNIITELVFDDTVRQIGTYSFYGLPYIQTVTLPQCVSIVGASAFEKCSGLEEVTIPGIISFLEWRAFANCPALNSITFEGEPPRWGFTSNTFENVTATAYYPINRGWREWIMELLGENADITWVSYIAPEDPDMVVSGVMQDNITWRFDKATGTLYFSGEGDMPLYNVEEMEFTPWYHLRDLITAVEISEGITGLSGYAFCDSIHLSTVKIPSSMAKLGPNVFILCENLSKVEFLGDAPIFDQNTFADVITVAYYPIHKNWPETVRQDYGGHITWLPYGASAPILPAITDVFTFDLTLPASDLGVNAPDATLRATLTFGEDGTASCTWEAVDLTAFRIFFHDMFVNSYYAMAYGMGITDINEIEQYCMTSTGMSVSDYMDQFVPLEAITAAFTPAPTSGTYSYNADHTAIFTDLAIMEVPSDPIIENSFVLGGDTLYLNAASWDKPDYTFVCSRK